MRKSWRAFIVAVLAGLGPVVGCHQLPADKSVQDLKPVPQKEIAAKPLTAADVSDSLVAQAKALEHAKKHGEAVALYEKIRVKDPAQAQFASKRIAFLYLCNNELERAEQEYDALLQKTPRDVDVLCALADVAYRRGHFATAEKRYRDVLSKRPDHATAQIGLGMTLAHNGDHAGSLEMFKKAGLSDAKAYYEIGFILKLNGKREQAMAAYEQALKIDPTMQQARFEMSEMYRQDPDVAVRMTTPHKTGAKGKVDVEPPPPLPVNGVNGTSSTLMQRPTLLPDIDIPLPEADWPASRKK